MKFKWQKVTYVRRHFLVQTHLCFVCVDRYVMEGRDVLPLCVFCTTTQASLVNAATVGARVEVTQHSEKASSSFVKRLLLKNTLYSWVLGLPLSSVA